MGKGKYITKSQRQIKEADARIRVLLQMFGNFILDKRGIKEPVSEKELKDFVDSLNK